MTLIDTSAWIEFFRRAGNSEVKNRVATYIETGDAAICGPVLFELMSGARESEMAIVRRTLKFSSILAFPLECWEHAAAIEKKLRQNGVTVPRDDIFVASVALHYNMPLYASDPHFRIIRDRGRFLLKLA